MACCYLYDISGACYITNYNTFSVSLVMCAEMILLLSRRS